MAKQLSTKVEHCPRCRKLKAKGSVCKSCGYGSPKTSVAPVAKTAKPKSLDVNLNIGLGDITEVKINGVTFTRNK